MINTIERYEDNVKFYEVLFNKKFIGEFHSLEDGYFYFLPDKNNGGVWSSDSLQEIANKLNEINKPYEDNINEYFNKLEK